MRRTTALAISSTLILFLLSCRSVDPEGTNALTGLDERLLAPSPWTDAAGDVTLPNADMVSGTVVVGDGLVELRLQFAALPFPPDRTHFITWCMDLDQNPATGDFCGSGNRIGADGGVDLRHTPGQPLHLAVVGSSTTVLDADDHVRLDPATNTLRVCFAQELLGDSNFNYVVVSVFAGSGGENDFAPHGGGFGDPSRYFVNEVGTPRCAADSDNLCETIGALVDDECPCNAEWHNHGAYVSCVAHAATQELEDWRVELDDDEIDGIHGCIVSRRARTDCGR